MSTLANWSYTRTLTVWPASSYDQYGQPTFGTPYTLTGSWTVGGDVETDENGNEFVAMSKYYFELAEDAAVKPEREGYIKIGDHTATSDPLAAGAEKIRKVEYYDTEMFGADELPDWEVST